MELNIDGPPSCYLDSLTTGRMHPSKCWAPLKPSGVRPKYKLSKNSNLVGRCLFALETVAEAEADLELAKAETNLEPAAAEKVCNAVDLMAREITPPPEGPASRQGRKLAYASSLTTGRRPPEECYAPIAVRFKPMLSPPGSC